MILREDLMKQGRIKRLMRKMKWKQMRTPLIIDLIFWVLSIVFLNLFLVNEFTLWFIISGAVGSLAAVLSLFVFRLLLSGFKIYQLDIMDKKTVNDESLNYYVVLRNGKYLRCASQEVYNQLMPYTTELVWYYAEKITGIYRG